MRTTADEVLDYMNDGVPATVPELVENLGIPRRTIRGAMEKLLRDGKITVSDSGKGNTKVYRNAN